MKIHRLRTITRTGYRRSSLCVCFNTMVASDFCVSGTVLHTHQVEESARYAPMKFYFVLFSTVRCLYLAHALLFSFVVCVRHDSHCEQLEAKQMPCRRFMRLCVRKSRSRLHTDTAEHTKHLSHRSNRICMCV